MMSQNPVDIRHKRIRSNKRPFIFYFIDLIKF